MTEKQLKMYRTYKRFLRDLLNLCGSWYMKSGKFKYYWTVCVLLIIITYMILNLHMCYIFRHNLPIMMKCIGVSISSLSAILKVVTFLINRNTLINYHRTLDNLFEEEFTRNEIIREIMFSSLPTIYILTYVYSAVIIAMLLSYLMPAYLIMIRDLCHFRLTVNYTLPVSKGYGYFWTVPNNFLYHFHLFFETSGGSICSITACCMDSIFGFYVYQSASIFRAMAFKLTNPLPTEKLSDILNVCVGKHQKLLQCRNTLEHIYGPIVFWHIVTNSVLLCALIYDASSAVEFHFSDLCISLTYGTIKLLQTFIYSWYGTVLTDAGEEFRNAIYFGDWPNSDLDRHVRTSVILMMMQKPMTINAFFTSVDMLMFTNFVNTTISYFFLLQSINDKGE